MRSDGSLIYKKQYDGLVSKFAVSETKTHHLVLYRHVKVVLDVRTINITKVSVGILGINRSGKKTCFSSNLTFILKIRLKILELEFL